MGDQIDCQCLSSDNTCVPSYSTGDTAWVLCSAALVFIQTPALAIMQAGMVRRSGFLSMFLQVLAGMSVGGVLWLIWGFSLTYGKDHGHFIGDVDYAMLVHVDPNKCFAIAPTISTSAYIMYQLTFAIMTPVIVTGTWAERIHLPALFVFCALWPTLVWYPLAHWVWGGGWLSLLGAIDFAGGLIVHTSSGIAAFVVALMIGTPGVRDETPPEDEKNVGLTMIGGSLIWVGWLGFNGGSYFNASSLASLAVLNTQIAASIGSLVWGLLATLFDEKGSYHLLEFLNGGLAGLAGITASAGYVSTWAAFVIGIIATICAFSCQRFMKGKVFLSDTLDVASLQGAPGISGTFCAGLFAHYTFTGAFYGHPIQISYQVLAIMVTVLWSALWTYLIMVFIRHTVGIFPDERADVVS